MKIKIKFTVIIMMYLIAIAISEDLEIFRTRLGGEDGWTRGTDSFKIPPSLCDQYRSDSVNCARFGADAKSQNGDQCICSCSNENATLIFDENEWRCLKNAHGRELLGYNQQKYVHFDNEDNDNELRMLIIGDYKRVTLQSFWFKCRVDDTSSRYTGCDGSEVPFDNRLFKIEGANNHNFPYFLKVKSGVSNTEVLRGRIIKLGIRCKSNSGRKRPRINRTLMFKYEGNLTCSISTPTLQPSATTSPLDTTLTLFPSTMTRTTGYVENGTKYTQTSHSVSPTIISVIIPTVSVAPPTVSDASASAFDIPPTVSATPPTVPDILSTVSYTSPTVSDDPLTISDVLPTYSEVQPTVFDTPSTVSEVRLTVFDTPPKASVPPTTSTDTPTDLSSNVPARPSPGSERSTDNNSSFLGLITGLFASILGVIVFIVGFLVFRRRCSKSTNGGIRKDMVMTSPQTCSAYEPADENVYKELNFREPPIYASNYQVPYHTSETQQTDDDSIEDHVYAPLNISEGHNIYGHLHTQKTVYKASEDPVCDKVTRSHTHGPISINQPVYNLLEDLSVVRSEGPVNDSNNDTQPVYNVLEEPYIEPVDGSPDEPVYNTLEKRYPDDVAEPNDSEFINEPIYYILEEEPYKEFEV